MDIVPFRGLRFDLEKLSALRNADPEAVTAPPYDVISPHTAGGLDRSNENLPVAPYLDVYDAIDPSSMYFEDALRDGVLGVHVIQGNSCVIGGLSRLVRPIGRTSDSLKRMA